MGEATHHVIRGDSGIVLGHFPDNWFHGLVCDPPHGLSFMGAEWDAALPAQPIWDECFRVLRPGGHVWVISSDRMSTTVGFFLGLQRAGFAIEDYQTLHWLNLQGMPKSSDVSKTADKQAFRAWLEHVGAELTAADRRKAESAAVNGECPPSRFGQGEVMGRAGMFATEEAKARHSAGAFLLSSLLSSHWPSSASSHLSHWQAVIGEVPEGWDVSKPPGVRVKTGDYSSKTGIRHNPGGEIYGQGDGIPEATNNVTAPSVPLASTWSGWRGSICPFRPMVSDILHAQKPWRGTYLDCAREEGTGSVNVEAGRIPFEEGGGYTTEEMIWTGGEGGQMVAANPKASSERTGRIQHSSPSGRVPGNLLSYSDLLGSLQHQADLDAWAERCGLPTASAELLEAGLCYAPKPSAREKSGGLMHLRSDLSEEERTEVTQELERRGIVAVC